MRTSSPRSTLPKSTSLRSGWARTMSTSSSAEGPPCSFQASTISRPSPPMRAPTTLLHRHARHAPGQEDGEPGRRLGLPPVLCRRPRRRPAPTSPSSTGRSRGSGEAPTASPAPACASRAGEPRLLGGAPCAARRRPSAGRRARRAPDARLRGPGGPAPQPRRRRRRGRARTRGQRSPVPAEHQIRGLGPILISVPDLGPTDVVLTRVMGMRPVREYDSAPPAPASMSTRWARAARRPSCMSPSSRSFSRRAQGAGGVHHVAFRIPDADYEAWTERLKELPHALERPGRPLLLPQPLFPRAERHPVRDRHRRARLHRRRAAGDARRAAGAAALPRAARAAIEAGLKPLA